jgi:molecular chaperone GrpE
MSKAESDIGKPETNAGPESIAPIDPATLTPEQLGELKALAVKADEYWDRLLRITADLDNFKKRAAREKQDAVKYANATLVEKLLPVLDSFDMALTAAKTNAPDSTQSLQAGIAMVLQQLKAALAEAGLEEIDASGQPFDPNWHEAVSQQESDGAPEGHVLQQLRKGYKLRDRLLRPASVVVAKNPDPGNGTPD